MTTELFWLIMTAILAASLWIPYIVGVNTAAYEGKETEFIRPPDHSKMPAWIHRSHRAHLNLLEQFLPFSIIVIAGHMLNVATSVTAWCAILFFWLRVAHAIGMISGKAGLPIRPLIFTGGWLVTLVFAGQVLLHA